jgi:hypothetical protein
VTCERGLIAARAASEESQVRLISRDQRGARLGRDVGVDTPILARVFIAPVRVFICLTVDGATISRSLTTRWPDWAGWADCLTPLDPLRIGLS